MTGFYRVRVPESRHETDFYVERYERCFDDSDDAVDSSAASSSSSKRRREEIRLNPTLIRSGYLAPLLGDGRLASSVLASDAMGGDDLVFEQFYGKLKKVKESKLAVLASQTSSRNFGGATSAGELLAALVSAASAPSGLGGSLPLPPLLGAPPSAPVPGGSGVSALPAPHGAANVGLDTVDLCEAVTSALDPDYLGGCSSATADAVAGGEASRAAALAAAVEANTPSLFALVAAAGGVGAPKELDADGVLRPPFSFTPDEVYGKYLDLAEVHARAMQVPNLGGASSEPLSLQAFASLLAAGGGSTFGSNFFAGVDAYSPSSLKLAHRKKYHAFLVCLLEYLSLFLLRVSPFLDLRADIYGTDDKVSDFEARWKSGQVKGWESSAAVAGCAVPAAAPAPRRAMAVSSASASASASLAAATTLPALAESLRASGASKDECRALGLKEGGSEAERAARLWATKGLPRDQWPKKILAPAAADGEVSSSSSSSTSTSSVASRNGGAASAVDLAHLECLLGCLLGQLRPTLLATVGRIARGATQTPTERAREVDEEVEGRLRTLKAAGEDDDDEAGDAAIYNPKNIPLGWDGKPIPYWLYKLHGLNHSFPCEICGNESYRGRRAYEKHFAEAKHAFGMRCLGIPNSRHFHGVTGIEDAKRLWTMMGDKMGATAGEGGGLALGGESGRTGGVEEYEDRQGNVLSRVAYEDLARQGLL
jgi:splicing factor 3A subunit 3